MESDANSSSNYSSPSPNPMLANVGARFGCSEGNGNSTQLLLPPQYPRQSVGVGSFRGGGFHVASGGLLRQTTSPPGLLFSQITAHNGYGMGNYKLMGDGGTNRDLSPSSSIRLKHHLSFSSGAPSLLSRFTEVDNENSDPKVGNAISSGDNSSYFGSSEFPFGSWHDSALQFAESFGAIKREPDNDHKFFATSQQGQPEIVRPSTLSHHLSSTSPKTPSSEMLAVEKLLQLQDTVPCKIRAKRGCATHPRSIAERVRRTRISERMRKLQELVPNMDKQTNTADMLDLAVDYIKSLQKQLKALSDDRANCKCSASHR